MRRPPLPCENPRSDGTDGHVFAPCEPVRVFLQPTMASANLAPTRTDGTTTARWLDALTRRQELFVRGARAPHQLTGEGLQGSHCAWFGVGVTAGGTVSRGLPVDVLSLVYAQEMVRRAAQWSTSLVLVADDNAQAAGGDAFAVRRCSVDVQRRLTAVVDHLGFPVQVELASRLRQTHGLVAQPESSSLPPYVMHQLAQTEGLRRRGVGLKIGWALSGALLDERYFDDLHAREYGRRVDSLYITGGRTLDPRRPRACPYVCIDPQTRVLLHRDEDIAHKLARAPRTAARRYERLLGKLARAHCRLTGTERGVRPAQVLQGLLDDLP